jgi:3-deoxy-D-manno-octulosonic-acid transferase
MPLVVDLVYLALLVLCAPLVVYRLLRKGKHRDGWAERLLGRSPMRIGDRPCLWLHAVSVGEVNQLRPLVADLARRRPDWEVVISTGTPTGLSVARRAYPDLVTFYAPLDFSWAVRRALARIRPTVLALVELELWPNLVGAAKRAGARVAIINGRLSVRSHRGYRRLRGPLGPTLLRLDIVAAQSEEYAGRFADIGVPPSRIHVTGSIKYDGLETYRDNPRTLALREELGIDASEVVFVAGSTMEGEEVAAYAAYQKARVHHPRLRLVLVPRHPERCDRVASGLESRGEQVVRRSRRLAGAPTLGLPPIILIDTVGELGAVWGLADLAFVGGSLFPGRGGQNMMEPAAYGAAVLFGPYTSNFREAVEGLLSCGGARRVANASALAQALLQDLDDPETAAIRGSAGRAFVLAQEGATARTLAQLDLLFEPSREAVPA